MRPCFRLQWSNFTHPIPTRLNDNLQSDHFKPSLRIMQLLQPPRPAGETRIFWHIPPTTWWISMWSLAVLVGEDPSGTTIWKHLWQLKTWRGGASTVKVLWSSQEIQHHRKLEDDRMRLYGFYPWENITWTQFNNITEWLQIIDVQNKCHSSRFIWNFFWVARRDENRKAISSESRIKSWKRTA